MIYRNTLEAALDNLHEIEDLLKVFPANGNIPAIEIDLTMQKIRNLYELLLMMKNSYSEIAEGASVETSDKITDKKLNYTAARIKEEKPETEKMKEQVHQSEETQILSDKFKGGETLYESLHQSFSNHHEIVGNVKPVSDILSAIGLNDRFTFIRELFENNTPIFENTIKMINEAGNYDEACGYLNGHFAWDMESDVVKQLLDIVRRKFINEQHG
jgi:hypothetical protein